MDRPSDKWEFSLLVDQASRILEARGLFELYLGARLNQDHRASPHFLLRMTLSGSPSCATWRGCWCAARRSRCRPTLRTPAVGIKRSSMAAKVGEAGHTWWLLFAQDVKGVTAADALASGEQPYATAQELDTAARVHDHAAAPLDITVFRARAISDETASPLSAAQRKEIDEEFSRTLMDHAHDRMVARPTAGEYALLHERNKGASAIRDQLAAVAASHNLQAADLGIEPETAHLDPGVGAAEIIRDLRHKLQDRTQAVATVSTRSRAPIFIAAACIVVAIVAGILLYGRI